MTNLEWLKKTINEMSTEAFIDYCFDHNLSLWCSVYDCRRCDTANTLICRRCIESWLEAKHQKPMPELKVGMMVRVIDSYGAPCFGIIREYKGKNIVSYTDLDGGYDWIDDEDIIIDTVYDAPSVLYARNYDESIIWRRSE